MDAEHACRLNLPTLDRADAVRDFIACVAVGMLLGAITGADGARLLYAAQVATASLRALRRKEPAGAAGPLPRGGDSPSLPLFKSCAKKNHRRFRCQGSIGGAE